MAVAGVVAVVLLSGGGPVRAGMGPNQSWTQSNNGAWPTGSSDPDCSKVYQYTWNGQGPYPHGPCVQWARGLTGLHWAFDGGNNFFVYYPSQGTYANVHYEIRDAVGEFNNLPYQSPEFSNESYPCDLCYHIDTTNTAPPGKCAYEQDNGPQGSGNAITNAGVTLYWNLPQDEAWIVTSADQYYYQNTNKTSFCDLRHIIRHETIHAVGEGHSSMDGDLMYWAASTVEPETFSDRDSNEGLNTMYGPSGTGGVNCAWTIVVANVVEAHC